MKRQAISRPRTAWCLLLAIAQLMFLFPMSAFAVNDTNCVANVDGTGCTVANCATLGDSCLPRCAQFEPTTGILRITDCACVGPGECYLHVVFNGPLCVEPDNGGGTIDFPPLSCGYESPDEVWTIIDGLPPGTTIEMTGPMLIVSPPQREPGGDLGGEIQQFDAEFQFDLVGTGELQGFARSLAIPIRCETHSAPPQTGAAAQQFDSVFTQLVGSLIGDPDFDTLGMRGGEAIGLPSPGRVSLSRLPDGDFVVDSFFDITYEIEFTGAPGGVLEGLSGTTRGSIRMQSGSTISCDGDCPAEPCEPFITEMAPGLYSYCCSCEAISTEDFGDAPEIYPVTLAQNGARHTIVPGFFLGVTVDPEPDGQPHPQAMGDDVDAAGDDEDGVIFSIMVPGETARIDVMASTQGYLDAWIDFGGDGRWMDPGDQIFSAEMLVPGINTLGFAVPASAVVNVDTFARFRFSSYGRLSPEGPATNGEVEDYMVRLELNEPVAVITANPNPAACGQSIQFDGRNSTHTHPGHAIVLYEWDFDYTPGRFVTETNGPTALHAYPRFGTYTAALRVTDDNMPPKTNMTTVVIRVDQGNQPPLADAGGTYASIEGFALQLDAGGSSDPDEGCGDSIVRYEWDLNDDGTFDLVGAQPLVMWSNIVAHGLLYPADPATGLPDNRITLRVTDSFGLFDHDSGRIIIYPSAKDWGDAPNVYPTMAADRGAYHQILPGFYLGSGVDDELDGQASLGALGDDLDLDPLNPLPNIDDDTGIRFLSPLYPNYVAYVEVIALRGGMLNAWVDFQSNGTWNEPVDRIAQDYVLNPGVNVLQFVVPPLQGGPYSSYARFRLNRQGGLEPDGGADDGEVEDVMVEMETFRKRLFGHPLFSFHARSYHVAHGYKKTKHRIGASSP